MRSPAFAVRIAQLPFWGLLVYGWKREELNVKGIVVFVLLWLVGRLGLAYLPHGAAMFPSFVAVLDIALVLVIFKGNVRLT